MLIGVPKEIKTNENRVALVPAGAEALVGMAHQVFIESGAGTGSGFSTTPTTRPSARRSLPTPMPSWGKADMIIKVKEPIAVEWPRMRKGQTIFTYFHFAADEALTRAHIDVGRDCIAYETVQLPDAASCRCSPRCRRWRAAWRCRRAPSTSRSSTAGAACCSAACRACRRRKVVILGGGVVGINAAKMAAGLGADGDDPRHLARAAALPRRRHAGERARSSSPTATTSSSRSPTADLVIGAVLLPGAKAPQLITREDLKRDAADGCRDRGRRGGPGRLRRDDQADHAREPDVRGGRRISLRRGQHAGRGAAHLARWRSPTRRSPTRSSCANKGWQAACRADGALEARPQRGRRQDRLSPASRRPSGCRARR